MQMPAGGDHIRKFRAAHEGRVIAMPVTDLFHGAAQQHHVVGRRQARRRLERELALARTEFDLDRSQRQAERHDVAPDDLEHRLHLVVALLGEILIAVRQQADIRRLTGLTGVPGRHLGVFEFEDMAFDFETGDEVVAALFEASEHRFVEIAGRERDRPAVGEMNITQQPAGGRCPWQHAEAEGIRHHQHIGGAFHLRHAKTAAGGEHREHSPVRGVLGEHRGGDGASALERANRLARDQRFTPQDSVLIGERETDDLELLLLDDTPELLRRLALLVGPKAVTFDKTQRVTPSEAGSKCSQPNRLVLVVIARSEATKQSIPSFGGPMDCFASLAMTKKSRHLIALRWGTLSAISAGTGAAHGALRRRLTSTSIQKVSHPRVGPMPSMVAGPWMLRACAASRNMNGLAPPATFSISCRSRRRYCTIALSDWPRCSRVRS